MDGWKASELEALSWRLASELMRRHPVGTRLIRGHPGGGIYDMLWILRSDDGPGDIALNRHGTIQVRSRFDGRRDIDWVPTDWEQYRAADHRLFVESLESAAGLPVPSRARPATPATLTYRVLAGIAAAAQQSERWIEIQEGYIDTAGGGGGPNPLMSWFPVPEDLLRVRDDDLYHQPGYRFWFVVSDGIPLLGFEQTAGVAWAGNRRDPFDLIRLYTRSGRRVSGVVPILLQEVEGL